MIGKRFPKRKIEVRRIQKTGGSSFVITLPKNWLNSLSSNDEELKGKELGIIVQPDNSLLITPNISREAMQREKIIELTSEIEPSYLFRYLVSTYISGYTSIALRSHGPISPALRTIIRKYIQMVIGLEVIEEKEDYLLIKDLLNPVEMPFENMIKRMHLTAKSMMKSSIAALEQSDIAIAKEVCLRDDDIDRLHWLVARQANMMLRDVTLTEIMDITADMAANLFLISRIIERIGDHAVRIAENVINLAGQSLISESLISELKDASDLALSAFDRSIDALIERSIQKANDNIESIGVFEKKCEEITPMIMNQDLPMITAIPVDNIVESIRRIGEYAVDIAEILMNILAREDD
ncbi:MAG: PhoU domain-containing protein [Candidatus Hodarchaeales archaeon]